MAEDSRTNKQTSADDEPESLQPLLRDLEEPVSDELLNRVRRTIHRRTAAAQFSAFAWRTPGAILAELVRLMGYLPNSLRKERDSWK